MNVGLINDWMEQNGVRVEEIAANTGLHYNTVKKILRGKTKKPNPLTINAFAKLTGISLEELSGKRGRARKNG